MSEYVCPLCSADFPTLNRATRHIRRAHPEMSRDDYLIWRARATGKPACLQCGEPVLRADARYCSPRCAAEARRVRPLMVACDHCGTIFRREGTAQRYCSRRCAADARRARRSEAACAHCGRMFERASATQRFCSPRCAGEAWRTRRSTARPVITPGETHLVWLPDSQGPVPAVVINVLVGKDGRRRYPVVPLREPRRLVVVTDEAWARATGYVQESDHAR